MAFGATNPQISNPPPPPSEKVEEQQAKKTRSEYFEENERVKATLFRGISIIS